MGCFSVFPCFPSSNHSNPNISLNPTTSSSSANQGTGNNREIVLIKAPVVESITNAGVYQQIQTPVRKSRDNCEDQAINVGDSKTVSVDLDVVTNTDISIEDSEIVSMKEGSGKLGFLVQLENERERDDEKKKENGKLGVLVQIEIENERRRGVNVEIENGEEIERERKEEIRSRAVSDSSVSSYISYPPMHRYHSCVIHEDEERVPIEEGSPESLFSLSIDPSRHSKCCSVEIDDKEFNSPLKTNSSPELTAKSNKTIVSDHLHEKENLNLQQEQTSKDSLSDRKGKLKNDIAATPSLSSWLVGPEKSTALSKEQSQHSIGSDGASPLKRFEDRPILGALTLDEVKQISGRSTPRKSPCPNPDDAPIIGTVGSYWSHTGQATDSSSSCTSPFGMSAKSRSRESKALSSKRRLERAFDKSTD